MVFTFLKARGIQTGTSLVEEDKLEMARELEIQAKEKNVQLLLPRDIVVADKFAPDAKSRTVPVDAIPPGWMVGPALTALTSISVPMHVILH